MEDVTHSQSEERFYCFGQVDGGVVTNRHIQATRFSAYSGQYAAVTSIS
jgi:hypothetical protein